MKLFAIISCLSALSLPLISQAMDFADSGLASQILEVSSDKASYQINEVAILRASLSTKPNDPSYELDLVAAINGEEVSLQRITDFEFYAQVPLTQAGAFSFSAQVVLQEKEYARDLILAIQNLTQEIQQLESDLASETDPDRIIQLQNQIARKQSLKASSEAELQSHRSLVGNPSQVQFIVE